MGIAATAMAGATVGAGLLSAKGIKEQGKYEKAVHEQNARIAEMQAVDAIDRGTVEEGRHRLDVRALIGEQRTSMGAQGIEINDADESAGQVQLSARAQGEYDALLIRNNAAREAWGYRVQAQDSMQQGRLAEISSKNRARDTILGGFIGAGSMMVSGAGGRTRVPVTTAKAPAPATVYSGNTYGIG